MMSRLLNGLGVLSAIVAAMVGGIAHAGEARISGFYTAAPAGDPVVVTKQDGSSIAMFNLKGFVIVNDQSNPW